jgi:hypothetical protein
MKWWFGKKKSKHDDGKLAAFIQQNDWLKQRDTRLPKGSFVLFQNISTGLYPKSNYKRIFFEDGRVFRANNDQNTVVGVDKDFPKEPEGTLSAERVAELKKLLLDENFTKQSTLQIASPAPSEGRYLLVLARVGDEIHEVLYLDEYPKLVVFLSDPPFVSAVK